MTPEHFWSGGWWILPMAIPFVALVALGVAMYLFLWRGRVRPRPASGRPPSPPREPEIAMETLKRRYAKGEITREEFEQIKKDLQG